MYRYDYVDRMCAWRSWLSLSWVVVIVVGVSSLGFDSVA